MTTITYALGGLRRQPFHAGLNLFGLSVGVATVVALGMLTKSVDHTMLDALGSGGGDFTVLQEGSSGVSFSTIFEEEWHAIERMDGVDRAIGFVVGFASVPGSPFLRLIGITSEQFDELGPTLEEGESFRGQEDDAVFGHRAARVFSAQPGDLVTLGQRVFRVAGIVRTGNSFLDRAVFIPLETSQQIVGRQDAVNIIHVRVAPTHEIRELTNSIEGQFTDLTTVETLEDYRKLEPAAEIVSASNLAVSTMATILGGLAVAATMAKSALDRTHEIGVLRAVGWGARRVVAVVLIEALALAIIAVFIGSAAGIVGLRIMLLQPSLGSLIATTYSPSVVALAATIAVIVALAGSAYPTYRAIKPPPAEALRYE